MIYNNRMTNIKKNVILGLDFGTCNSSIIQHDGSKFINLIADNIIPSLIYIDNKKILFGNNVINNDCDPKYICSGIKRLLGRKWSNPNTQNIIKKLTYKVIKEKNTDYINIVTVKGNYRPINLIKLYLSYLYRIVQKKYINCTLSVIITIPAYYTDYQRKLMSDCVNSIGFNVLRIVNEPSSAAFYYGLNEKNDTTILVYDLGGGTLDVSLLEKDEGLLEVIGTRGDCFLGGNDFTEILLKNVLHRFKKKMNIIGKKISVHKKKINLLKKKCEAIKKILTKEINTKIKIDNFWGTNNLEQTITRSNFELWSKKLIERSIQPVKDLLEDTSYTKSDINHIILIGGASQMPFIKFELYKLLGTYPLIHSEHTSVVAKGAALYASKLSGNDINNNNLILIDVLPLSLGIETNEGGISTIIKRNTPLPAIGKKRYTTVNDGESKVDIKIYEGERRIANKNFLIGEFTLDGLKKLPKGIPIIEITIKIDVNGLINIFAEEIKGDVKNSILINGKSNNMTTKEIDNLIKEAEKYEDNELEHTLYLERSWELRDILTSIITNLANQEKIKENDKKLIKEELVKIESTYSNLHSSEILNIINKLKKKYSTLLSNTSEEYFEDNSWCEIDKKYTNKDIINLRRKISAKIKNYLNIVDTSDLSIISYFNQVAEWCQFDGLTLTQLKEKLDQVEEYWNEYNGTKDYKNELLNLCLFLNDEIYNGSFEISDDKINLLSNKLSILFNIIENSNYSPEDNFWEKNINELNLFCENLVK